MVINKFFNLISNNRSSIIGGTTGKVTEVQKDSIINETTSNVSEALNWISDIIKRYQFIKVSKLWEIYIDKNHVSFSSENLVGMISYIINSDLWFTWLDYKNVEKLVNNLTINEKIVKISASIKRNHKTLLEKIYKWTFEEKNWDLFFKFSNFTEEDLKYIRMLFWVWGFKETYLDMNFDDLFSYVWKEKGIRYWLEYDFLKSNDFSWLKRSDLNWKTIKIASSKKVINNKPDEIELWEHVKFSKIPKKNNDWNVDVKKYEYHFPQAKKMKEILTIKIWKKWENWIDVYWNSQVLENDFRLNLSNFISEWKEYIWIRSETNENWDTIHKLIAREDIYINLVRNSEVSPELKDYEKWKITWITAWKEIINKSNVWIETWDMEIKNNSVVFHQKADIENWYTLQWENIIFSDSNIFWKIISEQDLDIYWKSNICNWFLQSINWNIGISKYTKTHTNTRIFAMSWKVVVNWDIEHTTIIANEITINWNASSVNCIAKKIIVNWAIKSSKLKWENIKIDVDLWSNEIVVIIFYAIDKFKRHLELTKNKRKLFIEKVKIIENTINFKQEQLKNLKVKVKQNTDYNNKELTDGNLYNIEKEIELLKWQIQIILKKISEDDDYLSRIEIFLEQFKKDTIDDSLNITICNEKSDIILYPTWFIFDDNQHNLLNPNDIKSRKKDKLLFLDNIMKNNFNSDKHIKTPNNLNLYSVPYEQLYKELIDYLKSSNLNNQLDLEWKWNRLDIKRFPILKIKPQTFFETFSKRKISESDTKKFNIIRVSIDWFSDCYLNDISLKWWSFIVSKNVNLYEKDSICDVKFELTTDKDILKISSYFWITNIAEVDNYKRISWFFLDSSSESTLFQYFSYLDVKNNPKRKS